MGSPWSPNIVTVLSPPGEPCPEEGPRGVVVRWSQHNEVSSMGSGLSAWWTAQA